MPRCAVASRSNWTRGEEYANDQARSFSGRCRARRGVGRLRAGGWCVCRCRRRYRCARLRVCRSARCLCAAARHLWAAGDIWTAPLARILSLSLLVRRISRLLRPRLLRPWVLWAWVLRPWVIRPWVLWTWLLWTWLLRASGVATLERTSD